MEKKLETLSLKEILEKYIRANLAAHNYNFPESVSLNPEFPNKKLLPKAIHFMWAGSAFKNELHKETILEWQKLNPDYKIILWTDQTDFKEG